MDQECEWKTPVQYELTSPEFYNCPVDVILFMPREKEKWTGAGDLASLCYGDKMDVCNLNYAKIFPSVYYRPEFSFKN